MAGEIDQIAATIEVAEDNASDYSRDLVNAAERLGEHRQTAPTFAPSSTALAQATRSLTEKNARLQTQLQAMSEEIAQIRRDIVDLRTESQTDPLTGLGNRRFFITALERAIVECRATNEPLTLLIADVDGIKAINENYGNIVGDRVLRFIAMVTKEAITGRDVAARYSDDAFAIILPTMSLPPAVRIAEQLRHAVMKCELVRRTTGEKARLTLSVGVASLDKRLAAQGLIETAEMCLFAAKRVRFQLRGQRGRREAVRRAFRHDAVGGGAAVLEEVGVPPISTASLNIRSVVIEIFVTPITSDSAPACD